MFVPEVHGAASLKPGCWWVVDMLGANGHRLGTVYLKVEGMWYVYCHFLIRSLELLAQWHLKKEATPSLFVTPLHNSLVDVLFHLFPFWNFRMSFVLTL